MKLRISRMLYLKEEIKEYYEKRRDNIQKEIEIKLQALRLIDKIIREYGQDIKKLKKGKKVKMIRTIKKDERW